MPHLIKLESGQLMNLDNFLYTTTWEDGIVSAIMVNGYHVTLSPKDLKKIEKIASLYNRPEIIMQLAKTRHPAYSP